MAKTFGPMLIVECRSCGHTQAERKGQLEQAICGNCKGRGYWRVLDPNEITAHDQRWMKKEGIKDDFPRRRWTEDDSA